MLLQCKLGNNIKPFHSLENTLIRTTINFCSKLCILVDTYNDRLKEMGYSQLLLIPFDGCGKSTSLILNRKFRPYFVVNTGG